MLRMSVAVIGKLLSRGTHSASGYLIWTFPLQRKDGVMLSALSSSWGRTVPLLVKVVTSPSDPFKVEVGALANRILPARLQVADKWADAAYRQRLGVEGLRALGPAATVGIPALADFLTSHPYPGM